VQLPDETLVIYSWSGDFEPVHAIHEVFVHPQELVGIVMESGNPLPEGVGTVGNPFRVSDATTNRAHYSTCAI
jgi:hypothetical protein